METNDTEISTFQNLCTCNHLSTSAVVTLPQVEPSSAEPTLQAATSYRQYLLIKLDLITPQYLHS